VVDQRHRAVIAASYNLPYHVTAGTLVQLASARPFNSVTGLDNNGDGGQSILLRLEGFNLFNHGNILGRAQTTYGDTAAVNPTFGQVVAAGTASNALPALANIDPPRMFQFQVRFLF
jgi:hypothetical protein